MELDKQQILIKQVDTALKGEGRRHVIEFLQRQRWFGGKGRPLVDVRLSDAVVLSVEPVPLVLAIMIAEYRGGEQECYVMPCSIRHEVDRSSDAAIVELPGDLGGQWLCDATRESDLWNVWLRAVAEAKTFMGQSGSMTGGAMAGRQSEVAGPWSNVTVLSGEQSNTSVVFDRQVIVKLIRKVEMGINPEEEVLEFLTTQTSYDGVPSLLGSMLYESTLSGDLQVGTLSLVERFVPNRGDGWSYVLTCLDELIEQIGGVTSIRGPELAKTVCDIAGSVLSDIRRLGEVTGNLHLALSSSTEAEAFRSEPITERDCEDWRARMLKQLALVCWELRAMPLEQQSAIGLMPNESTEIETACWKRFEDLPLLAQQGIMKIRHHGDYHLGQVLKTDESFTIIDFEGEPVRPLADRRAKVCPLKDVAGMLRSFNYAAQAALRRHLTATATAVEGVSEWERAARDAFLDGYRSRVIPGQVMFLPVNWVDTLRVLRVYELDKALYELRYELRNRPEWVSIPLQGIRRVIREAAA